MTNPLDDPTCHQCPIAAALRDRAENMLAEIARLKGTSVDVQRVSHGTQADDHE